MIQASSSAYERLRAAAAQMHVPDAVRTAAAAAPGDPRPGQIWRAVWDGVVEVVAIAAVDDTTVHALPVSLETRFNERPGSPRCGVRPAESERAKPEPRRSAWPKRQGSSTRPRSWTGVNPRRVTARDNPAVGPVLSAIRRSTADPVCDPVPIDVDRQIFRPRAVVHLKSAPRPGCPAVSADRITPAQGHFSLFRHATFKITANGGGRHGRPDGGSVEFRCRRPRRAGGLGSPGAAGPGPVEAPSGDVRDPRIGTGGRGSAELVGPRTSAAWRRTRREGEISAANSVSASAHRASSSGRPRTRRRPTATSPPRSSSPRDRAPRPA